MAMDPRRRQKKREQMAARRKAKQKAAAREHSKGIAELLTETAHCPILHSMVADSLHENGLGHILLSRKLYDGRVAYAMFLIDRYCLGVKDALAYVSDMATYNSRVVENYLRQQRAQEVPAATARKFVEDAVTYARTLGLHPHPDYHKAKPIFGDLDPADSWKTLEFGQDGKPFFVSGPYDTPSRCRAILNTLLQSCGPDGFRYLLPAGLDCGMLPEEIARSGFRTIGQGPGEQFWEEVVAPQK